MDDLDLDSMIDLEDRIKTQEMEYSLSHVNLSDNPLLDSPTALNGRVSALLAGRPAVTSVSDVASAVAVQAAGPVRTLVFFDLETTGLGHIVGKSNVQITEISLIAVDRKDFENSLHPDLRDIRIIHKLSLCVRPRTPVSPGAAKVTGLDNFNLLGQQNFNANVAQTVVSFLSHLPKPVCLLAHNGNSYDFPLLNAEFKRLNVQLPLDLLIADTLVIFKTIGICELPPEKKPPKSVKYNNGRLSLSLENLHLYLFGKRPRASHSSEGDCISLAKVCHKMKNDFLAWIDKNSCSLESVKPMW